MKQLTFGSLFAGIGGFDLGLERAGMKCEWQVEINDFARKVLRKHWPKVRRRKDVRTFPPEPHEEWKVDLISGGFPCQDISLAGGKGREGIEGKRSGLWTEYARIVRVLRPRYVLVENSPALGIRGLTKVLGDLARLGFDAEWSTVSACSLGSPHTRNRMFVVAHTDTAGLRESWRVEFKKNCKAERDLDTWKGSTRPVGVVDGVPDRVDRCHGLGNSVCPQVVELIGRAILEADKEVKRRG